MKHTEKRHLGFRMRTRTEEARGKEHEGIFTSAAWEKRKAGIAARVARRQTAAAMRAQLRREKAQLEGKTGIISAARRKLIERRLDAQRRRSDRNRRWQAKHHEKTTATAA